MITDWKAGQVFKLNYDVFGPELPELAGEHWVVVVSSRTQLRDKNKHLVTVVPLTPVEPNLVYGYSTKHNVPLEKSHAWGGGPDDSVLWARCGMVSTVTCARLDHVFAHAASRKTDKTSVPQVSGADLKRIRVGCVHAVSAEEYVIKSVRSELASFIAKTRQRLAALSGRRKPARAVQREYLRLIDSASMDSTTASGNVTPSSDGPRPSDPDGPSDFRA